MGRALPQRDQDRRPHHLTLEVDSRSRRKHDPFDASDAQNSQALTPLIASDHLLLQEEVVRWQPIGTPSNGTLRAVPHADMRVR
jgi:hypothetical protein